MFPATHHPSSRRAIPIAAVAVAGLAGVIGPAAPGWRLDGTVAGGAPNLWAWLEPIGVATATPLTGLGFALAAGAAGWLGAQIVVSGRGLPDRLRLRLALLAVLLAAQLLPQLGPAAFAPAAAIALLLAACDPRQDTRRAAALIVAGAVSGLVSPAAVLAGAVMTVAATIIVARRVLVRAANDNSNSGQF